jgi:hypothetical protein
LEYKRNRGLCKSATNADLGWEYSKTQNYGVDFGLFNNRLTGTIEYYKTHTYDF